MCSMYENNKLTNPLFLILSCAVHVSLIDSRSGFIMQKLLIFHCCLVRNDKFLTVQLNSSSVEYIKQIKAWKCTENDNILHVKLCTNTAANSMTYKVIFI